MAPLSLLLVEDPGPLRQQLQATRSQDHEPLSSHNLSQARSEYLPFFRTYGRSLSVEELALSAEVGRDQEADSAPPSGFFPYYRSRDDYLPSILQNCWCLGCRDSLPRNGVQEGCFKVTARDGCPGRPDLIPGDSPLSRGHVPGASGFVPYYRSAEEMLRTSLVPPSSMLGSPRE
uniref:Uncharacterized protein n=1 Tax=Nannospalax galili TaxID=1026970 RepID=A0A8C6QJS6_NANGA